jgi:hypothetical protein
MTSAVGSHHRSTGKRLGTRSLLERDAIALVHASPAQSSSPWNRSSRQKNQATTVLTKAVSGYCSNLVSFQSITSHLCAKGGKQRLAGPYGDIRLCSKGNDDGLVDHKGLNCYLEIIPIPTQRLEHVSPDSIWPGPHARPGNISVHRAEGATKSSTARPFSEPRTVQHDFTVSSDFTLSLLRSG